jgi:hypothetical protein
VSVVNVRVPSANGPSITVTVPTTQGPITPNSVKVSGTVLPPVAYHHRQGIASNTWVIAHNLGFYPNVTTMDSAGSITEGEIVYNSVNQLTVTFSAPFSGNAYLS